MLLTYNGKWGDFEWSPHLLQSQHIDELIAEMKKTEMIQQLWEKVQEQALQISQRVGAEDHAVGLEICTQTLKEGRIKVHVHLALMSSSAILDMSAKKVELLESRPYLSKSHCMKKADQGRMPHFIMWWHPKLGSCGRIRAYSHTRIS